MVEQIATFLEQRFNIPADRSALYLRRAIVISAAALFVLAATMIVAFDDIFTGRSSISSLQIGEVVPVDITSPKPITYTSQILTERRRLESQNAVPPVFDPPDPNVARQRAELARQILDYIANVRADIYADFEQKMADIGYITALKLEPDVIQAILEMDDETWRSVDEEIVNVLTRVMRESIRESQLETLRLQLPTQVSIRFNATERDVIVAILANLVRPNTFENPEATAAARQAAAEAITPVQRTFARGETVLSRGEVLDEEGYEALQALGLLTSDDLRLQESVRAFIATVVVMVVTGIYIIRFKPSLILEEYRLLTLIAVLFLIELLGARIFGGEQQIYIYPNAALALILVAISGPEIAVIGAVGLSLLIGMMAENSLEVAAMVAAGGIIGALTLRRQDRFSSYLYAGILVGIINAAVVAAFNIGTSAASQDIDLITAVVASLINGLLVAAVAIAGMYAITFLFNLPTSMKLVELSQPSQPLLQRLLREAPGTYQHSLQVANLSEQAANAIGANAELCHVAALYHDIGKLLNPAFFVENQQDMGNPHDKLNDPYRSADIIISHVTGGDELARQYRLPNRIRDFIREHHGTTKVYVFYKRAIERAGGDENAVDREAFTYPGPKPQSRETAIMMIADACESAARAIKPTTKKAIIELVQKIIEDKRSQEQLDESGLTLNDLKTIESILVEMLQAIFHPRIDYNKAAINPPLEGNTAKKDVAPPTLTDTKPKKPAMPSVEDPRREQRTNDVPAIAPPSTGKPPVYKPKNEIDPVLPPEEDEGPLPEVPPLPRLGENGKPSSSEAAPADEDKPHVSD